MRLDQGWRRALTAALCAVLIVGGAVATVARADTGTPDGRWSLSEAPFIGDDTQYARIVTTADAGPAGSVIGLTARDDSDPGQAISPHWLKVGLAPSDGAPMAWHEPIPGANITWAQAAADPVTGDAAVVFARESAPTDDPQVGYPVYLAVHRQQAGAWTLHELPSVARPWHTMPQLAVSKGYAHLLVTDLGENDQSVTELAAHRIALNDGAAERFALDSWPRIDSFYPESGDLDNRPSPRIDRAPDGSVHAAWSRPYESESDPSVLEFRTYTARTSANADWWGSADTVLTPRIARTQYVDLLRAPGRLVLVTQSVDQVTPGVPATMETSPVLPTYSTTVRATSLSSYGTGTTSVIEETAPASLPNSRVEPVWRPTNEERTDHSTLYRSSDPRDLLTVGEGPELVHERRLPDRLTPQMGGEESAPPAAGLDGAGTLWVTAVAPGEGVGVVSWNETDQAWTDEGNLPLGPWSRPATLLPADPPNRVSAITRIASGPDGPNQSADVARFVAHEVPDPDPTPTPDPTATPEAAGSWAASPDGLSPNPGAETGTGAAVSAGPLGTLVAQGYDPSESPAPESAGPRVRVGFVPPGADSTTTWHDLSPNEDVHLRATAADPLTGDAAVLLSRQPVPDDGVSDAEDALVTTYDAQTATWSPVTPFDVPAGAKHSSADLVVTDGEVFAAFVQRDSVDSPQWWLTAHRWSVADAPGEPTRVDGWWTPSFPNPNSTDHAVRAALDPSGHAHVVWARQNGDERWQVRTAEPDGASGWTEPVDLTRRSYSQPSMTLLEDDEQLLLVVQQTLYFGDQPNQNRTIRLAHGSEPVSRLLPTAGKLSPFPTSARDAIVGLRDSTAPIDERLVLDSESATGLRTVTLPATLAAATQDWYPNVVLQKDATGRLWASGVCESGGVCTVRQQPDAVGGWTEPSPLPEGFNWIIGIARPDPAAEGGLFLIDGLDGSLARFYWSPPTPTPTPTVTTPTPTPDPTTPTPDPTTPTPDPTTASPSPSPSSTTGAPVAPGRPTAVVASASNRTVRVSWRAGSGPAPTGYTVWVRATTAPSWAPSIPRFVTAPTTRTTYTGLRNGLTYAFGVVAHHGTTTSPWSATVGARPIGSPAKPTKLKATTKSNVKTKLTWKAARSTAANPVTGYRIYVNGKLEKTTTSKSWTHSGKKGKRYTYTVRAYNAVGTSKATTTRK